MSDHPDLQRIPNVFPRFEIRQRENPELTAKNGYATFDDVEWCVMVRKGSGAETPERVSRLMKDKELWPHVEPHYRAWKEKREAPTDGFPLEQWPGCTRAQVDTLRQLNIRSVEDVAGMNDAAMQRFGMGASTLRQKARAWLDTAKQKGLVAEEVAGLRAENAAKDERIAQLEEDMAELRAALDEMRPRGTPEDTAMAPRRGRPPKPRDEAA